MVPSDPAASGLRAAVARLGGPLLDRAHAGLGLIERRLVGDVQRQRGAADATHAIAFVGTVWQGGAAEPQPGCVVIDPAGRISDVHLGERPELPASVLAFGGANHWVVPGIVDAHVHLVFDESAVQRDRPSGLATGVVAVRDLGGPPRRTHGWQTARRRRPPAETPRVAIAGPVLTALDGYPSRTWGRECAQFVASTNQARSTVRQLASDGVDLIKVALDDTDGGPLLEPKVLRAIVEAAHRLGLPVVAHALTDELVRRALDCGVDELAHTPTERLSAATISRMADARMSVTSTLQTFFSSGSGREAAANAADLVAAGVVLRYGTDFGNAGTRTGVDPRELDRLADTGLGRLGALRAATEHAANAPGMKRLTGTIAAGQPASLVLLPTSPLDEPGVWRTPTALFTDSRLTVGAVNPGSRPAAHR